jgi:hypothetical protein
MAKLVKTDEAVSAWMKAREKYVAPGSNRAVTFPEYCEANLELYAAFAYEWGGSDDNLPLAFQYLRQGLLDHFVIANPHLNTENRVLKIGQAHIN